MKNRLYNLVAIGIVFLLIVINVSYAEEIIDKKGRIVYEVTKPTAESTIDPDTILSADRRVAKLEGKYEGPSKNIFSKDILYSDSEWTWNDTKEFTLIRHTSPVTDLSEEKYQLNQDERKDRLRLTIVTSDGLIEGKNGFFKINEKTFYFDEEGLMVLGPCYDTIGNYYFFSYETGELIEEIQKR